MAFRRYVPVEERRRNAQAEQARMRRQGKTVQPIHIEGREIARTFWGKAWCEHLESFSDFENRLPRGRTYVRNGSVCHLEIGRGTVRALVQGSDLYEVTIGITPLAAAGVARDQGEVHREDRLPAGPPARTAFIRGDGDRQRPRDRALPEAARDPPGVLLPGLGLHVQARCRRAVRGWRSSGRETRATLPASGRGSRRADRDSGRGRGSDRGNAGNGKGAQNRGGGPRGDLRSGPGAGASVAADAHAAPVAPVAHAAPVTASREEAQPRRRRSPPRVDHTPAASAATRSVPAGAADRSAPRTTTNLDLEKGEEYKVTYVPPVA